MTDPNFASGTIFRPARTLSASALPFPREGTLWHAGQLLCGMQHAFRAPLYETGSHIRAQQGRHGP